MYIYIQKNIYSEVTNLYFTQILKTQSAVSFFLCVSYKAGELQSVIKGLAHTVTGA